jgi:F-type H+-transporting ATPase subunit b
MEEIFSKIGFDIKLTIANVINFLVVFWVLKSLVFKPIKETIEQRQKEIDYNLSLAENSKQELIKNEEDGKKIINQAKQEADNILRNASDKARILEEKSILKTKEEVEKIKNEAEKEIGQREAVMERKLQEKTLSFALKITEKIIDSDLDDKTKQRFNDQILNKNQ